MEKENAEILWRFQRFSLFGRSVGIRTRGLLDPNDAQCIANAMQGGDACSAWLLGL